MNSSRTKNSGFGLVEIVIGSAILSVSLLSISNLFQLTLRASSVTQSAVQGNYILEEGLEITKLLRDTSYATNILGMSTTVDYHYSWNGTTWVTTTVNTLIDGKFDRTITFANVNRDLNGDIAATGTNDPNVRLATVSISWRDPIGTTTRSVQAYIVNIFGN